MHLPQVLELPERRRPLGVEVEQRREGPHRLLDVARLLRVLQAVEERLLPRGDENRPERPAAHPLARRALVRGMGDAAHAPEQERRARRVGAEAAFEADVVGDPVCLEALW